MDIRIDFSFNNAYNKTIKKAGDNVLQDIDILSLANFNKLNIPQYSNLFKDIEILWFNTTNASKYKYMMTQRSHHHSFFEVHFVFLGEIFYKINNDTFNISCGNYIVIPPKQNHKIHSYSSDMSKLSLGFSLPSSNPFYELITKNSNKNTKISPQITESIAYIQGQLKKDSEPFMFGIQNRILEIIYSLPKIKLTDSVLDTENFDYDSRIHKAKQYIKYNISSHITCTDIATHCYLSTKQLTRLFQKYENKSLLEYLHEQKIKHIQKLLCDSEKSLKQISIDSGFINESYFNSFFKKHAGQTPGDYRLSSPNKSTSPE